MLESNTSSRKIDLNLPYETERKFTPVYPEKFLELCAHPDTMPIEQLYLSSPDEPFSLRLREYVDISGVLAYEATLKDRGDIQPAGLRRLEVNVPISPELYQFYKSNQPPVIRKLRSEPVPEVVVDFYEDGAVQIESENEAQWQEFKDLYGEDFVEITGGAEGSNEHRAYSLAIVMRDEVVTHESNVTSGDIVQGALAASKTASQPVMVHVGGRSGSGKSTIVREVVADLETFGVSSCILSTDDYHRGAKWLTHYNNGQTWEHWDDPIVYDTATMRRDLKELRSGLPILKRKIDWEMVEPRVSSEVHPADIVIIEGIYATAPEITTESDLVYRLNTPLATCVGRRLLRDINERPEFADPVKNLAYMLSEAEPAYLRQCQDNVAFHRSPIG